MTTTRNLAIASVLMAAALAFACAGCDGGGGGKKDGDAGDDAPADTGGDEGIVDLPEDDAAGDPAEDEPPPDAEEEDAAEDPVEEDAEEETTPTECGNGAVDEGEVCDDGNTETEFCGGEGDCLGDCSLDEGACGNAELDDGEACDDGDSDSMNDCTTSCTVNDHNIGDPCTCTGGDCNDRDFTAGNLAGCDNVAIPEGSGGELACLRSVHDPVADYDTFYAGGYCTIIAVTCEGGSLCSMVPQPGDINTFACPAGYYEHEDSRDIMGLTIRSKTCLKICESPADCRWNEHDDFREECGQYDCVEVPGDPTTHVCYDERGRSD